MDPFRQSLDQNLLVVGIAAYVTGALVLLAYFLFRKPVLRTIGLPLAVIGVIAQFAELGARWWMTGVWPLTNLYGSLSLFSACAVAIFLIFAFRYDLAFIGGPVLALAAIALGYATTWNEGYMPAVPALQSYWIKIHVPIVISAYASFMVAFCVSIIYLVKAAAENRYARRGSTVRGTAAAPGGAQMNVAMSSNYGLEPAMGMIRADTPALTSAAAAGDATAQWLVGLPSLARLDVMQYRIIAVGLPLLSLGIITGAMWAKEAWGAYWQWDPKETAALLSWIVYAGYMHLHTRPNLRGTFTAWISILGFVSIIFCYLGVNIWISGLHSYRM
ncbi:MAG: putative Cytochrome c assembly protein [Candidatus Eremiobacteraeota bacterium]|nr:putative Cytochrome c assembly protein [Candidatus Eremiobacteraeota bacterium]